MKRFFGRGLVVVAMMTLGAMLWADPLIPTLYNTGVNDSHAVLLNGAVDTHYKATPPGASPFAVTSAGGFPVGPWIGDNSLSTWVRPTNNSANGETDPNGSYAYTTTFDLTGRIGSTAQITGRWSSDNNGLGIKINGVSVTPALNGSFVNLPPYEGFRNWYSFGIFGGFLGNQVNTLEFTVVNGVQSSGNPSGLRVEMTGTAAVPEGAESLCLVLMAGGLFLVAARRKSMVRLQ